MSGDARFQALGNWLAPVLAEVFAARGWGAVPQVELRPASSDASFRRYFRWEAAGRSLILMDAPPPQEDCRPFVRVAGMLAGGGVHVPQILAADLQQGFLLLDDLGRQTWLHVLDEGNADALFAQALETLIAIQKVPAAGMLPEYDDALLRRELQLFPDWYLQRHLGVELDAGQQQLWQQVCDLLVSSALAQPRVLVHRDFMPRNLMDSQPNPGVLDFQDAVYGPVSYDVTCLFKDAFLSWPQEKVDQWLGEYWKRARAAGIELPDTLDGFLRASDLMGAQRHLKVIGIFARICHRDGKPAYLADVPRFFIYLQQVIARRPELAPLQQLLSSLGVVA